MPSKKSKQTAVRKLALRTPQSSTVDAQQLSPTKAPASNKPTRRDSASSGGNSGPDNAVSKPSAKTGGETFAIVGIGASAGGLEALTEFFEAMPTDAGMAFVVVTHQHPGQPSLLPELLAKVTGMPVVAAVDGLKVKPNHVYVALPGGSLAILHGKLHRMESGSLKAPNLPIDSFLRSLAVDQRERAVCIILSGTGTDGTLGLREIKSESGMVMAEQPQAARYSGMPSSAIATGLADYVLPPQAMPRQLISYTQGLRQYPKTLTSRTPDLLSEPMQKIFVMLRTRTGHDFSAYKDNTIRRRIERRMNVHQLKDPREYVHYLAENPHEIDVLFKELLISVTNFFRDPQAWESLGKSLIKLIQLRPDDQPLRVWVPGCATGEEVYSIAILLRECLENTQRHCDVQIFGTDLDASAIETARAGRYPDGIAVDVPPQRLERFFIREEGGYRIRKEMREMAIFAQQNVIKDPPFTKLDLICCRNLLIYLNSDLQQKLLPVFHYALKPHGLLFLGPSETHGSSTDLFAPVDKRWKIFRRKGIVRTLPEIPAPLSAIGRGEAVARTTVPLMGETQVSTLVERLLLGRFAPASVMVNELGEVIYIHGRTGEYLEPSQGQPRHNIVQMAREGLQIELATALRECRKRNKEVVRTGVRVRTNGSKHSLVTVTVTPVREPEAIRGLLLVTFRPTPPAPAKPAGKHPAPRKGGDVDRMAQLERELRHIKESQQATLEALETSNEELKSTNEELQSTNEELQSSNEELETSKEELQSLNEELTTVNTELQSKVEDLSQASNDMQNLLNSTDIATVFLDGELNIKRFTEQAKDLITLRPSDVGRPICELASKLDNIDLVSDCREVLRTLASPEREVCTRDGIRYLMRIRPYRTTENVIDGLVITFVNIQQLREAELAGEKRAFFESIVEAVRHPLLVLDEKHQVVAANGCYYETFRLRPKQVVGLPLSKIGGGEWDIPELRELLDEVLPRKTTIENYKLDHEFAKIGRRVFLVNARQLIRERGAPNMILIALEDATGR